MLWSKQLFRSQDLLGLPIGKKTAMDSITRLLRNLTYRNVQILLLCLQKIIKQPDSFFTYPFKTFCQNLNPRATPPASHKPAQQSCSGCQSCYFSLFQHGLTPPLPEPCLTCAHTRAHTHKCTHTEAHVCTHADTRFFRSLMQPKYPCSEHSDSWAAVSCLHFVLSI